MHQMKCVPFAVVVGLTALAGSASAAPSRGVFGHWLTDDGAGIVEVKRCGASLCGTLVRVLDPKAPAHDINNRDASLRGRPLVGVPIIYGMHPDGDGWKGGRAYDPKAGRSYRASLALGEKGRLDVTGCILFLCQTKHWTRVAEESGR